MKCIGAQIISTVITNRWR